MGRLRELLTTDSESELIQTEIYATLIEAVKDNLVGTQLLAFRAGPTSIPGSVLTVTLATKDSMDVHAIGEGAEIPIDDEAYSSFNLTPVKYGLRPMITKEMQEDAKFALMELQLKRAGYEMAKKLDSLIMTTINAGSAAASHDVTTVGAAITIGQITSAMYNLEFDGYHPTDFILSAEVASDIRNIDTFVEADKAGIANPGVGLIGTIFGMKVWVTNQVTAKSAYIIDRNHAVCLAEKRPITVVNYNDVTHDMSGIAVTARWHSRYLRENACSEILTS